MIALTQPLKWHGGKHYLAKDIIDLMPPHTHYVDPYAGGLSVLLRKDPQGTNEIVNDLNGPLTNFWRVLRNRKKFAEFQRAIQAVPMSEAEWEDARESLDDPDPIERAVAFYIRCRQSLAGRMESFTGISSTRVRRGMNEQASAWLSAVDGLPAVHARLRRVMILRRNALDVIRKFDGPQTLFNLDPPYLDLTRTAPDVYAHEMSRQDHVDLLKTLKRVKGKFLLSGYDNALYARAAELYGWQCHRFEISNHAAGGKSKRRMVECVWTNFVSEG